MAELQSDGARLLYTWLLPNLDINGCYSADPKILNAMVFTRLKKTEKKILEYLEDMQRVGSIIIYKVNNDIYLQVPDFAEKQPSLNPDREASPTIPPPTPDLIQTLSGQAHLLSKDKVKQSKEKDKEKDKDENFDVFWKLYPRKVGKADARKVFSKIKPDGELLQKFLSAVAEQKNSGQWKRDNGQYIPYPATWLNGERWNDQLPPDPREEKLRKAREYAEC